MTGYVFDGTIRVRTFDLCRVFKHLSSLVDSQVLLCYYSTSSHQVATKSCILIGCFINPDINCKYVIHDVIWRVNRNDWEDRVCRTVDIPCCIDVFICGRFWPFDYLECMSLKIQNYFLTVTSQNQQNEQVVMSISCLGLCFIIEKKYQRLGPFTLYITNSKDFFSACEITFKIQFSIKNYQPCMRVYTYMLRL